MLYLPKGVREILTAKASEKGTNLGSYLIQLSCLHARDLGLKCDHPEVKTLGLEEKKGRKKRIVTCKTCGITLTRLLEVNGVRVRGAQPLEVVGFPFVSTVGHS